MSESDVPEPVVTPTKRPKPKVIWSGEGTLREYYLHGKYPPSERDAVTDVVGRLFPHFDHAQQHQMAAEILSYHHVVFHNTKLHDLRNNHKVIKKHRESLRDICKQYGVPYLPVLAITSWENSGGSNKVSWADAVGLGMMTWGAVDQAHRHAADKAKALKEAAKWKRYHADAQNDPEMLKEAIELEQRAAKLNVEQRHRKRAKEAGVKDERAIAECNLEDVVLFFDYLLSQYGGRVDHAIAAYHKGVRNQDDIVYDYLRRRVPDVVFPKKNDRVSFLASLDRLNVSYLDLWNDKRSREMLNGLRTVEGEQTTSRNSHLALGDESDIYPWKVLASLSALLAGEEYLDQAVARYSGPQLAGEVHGLPAFKGAEGRAKGQKLGCLVKYSTHSWRGDSRDARQSWIRPELVGYLEKLRERMKQALGGRRWVLPVSALGLAPPSAKPWEQGLHSKGVAVKIPISGMDSATRKALTKLLNQDYLFDRIYLRTTGYHHHFVLNPRFGLDYLKVYESSQKS